MLCLLISSGAKLRRRCYKLFAIALQYGYNAAADRFLLYASSCMESHCYMLHVTCYVKISPTSISASSRSGDKSCKRSSQIHVALVAWSRIVTCYMLHVTLRSPPLPSPPPREAVTSRVSVLLRYTSHWSHGVALLHVTLRPPPLPPPPPREALYLLFSCFPADLCFFYSLAREKSNCSPPPSRLLTRMLPRWRMTAFLTMASPSPVPPSDRLRPLSTR